MEKNSVNKNLTIEQLIQYLKKQKSIPALDENISELVRLTKNQSASSSELTSVIMRDAALTSRLLAVANSVSYRRTVPVRTVSSAVVLFGFSRIQELAVGLSVFNKYAGSIRDKELYRLLVCAYCCGNLALQIANAVEDENPEELFVAGLMRQMPRLVLANGFPELYSDMEALIKEKGYDIERACKEVFGLSFSAITDAIEECWNLKGDQSNAPGKSARERRHNAIDMAVNVSDLLFGNRPTGPDEVGKISSSLKQVLKKREFSLPEFVGKACDADPNIEDFFNLTSQDMVMMTRIAEWGKVSSTDVANSLTETREKEPCKEESEGNPSLMMAHCLSELTLAVRDGFSFSDILMIAQEGVFRCIPCECVIVMFLDQKKKFMKGKLCVGRKTSVDASRCQVTLNSVQGLAAKNIKGRDAEIFPCDPKTNILDYDTLLRELQIREVLLVPIRVGENAIGQFLLCRNKEDAPFSMDDTLWMNAIASHVGMSFAQL